MSNAPTATGLSTAADPVKEVWTVRDVLDWTRQRFASAMFPSPLLDAQLLLGSALGLSKVQLYTQLDKPLAVAERATVRKLVQRRLAGEPVAYILGQKDWHTLNLLVDKRVLIPRPETETLLDFSLSVWRDAAAQPEVIVDLCTGSGCLAIALALAFPEAKVVAVDISSDALAVAEENRIRNRAGSIDFIEGDVTALSTWQLIKAKYGQAHLVTANPPYLSESEWESCEKSVRDFEPRKALVAANSGLAIGCSLIDFLHSEEMLAAESMCIIEMGVEHPSQIVARFGSGSQPRSTQQASPELPRNEWFALRDLSRRERFVCFISGLALGGRHEDVLPTDGIK